MRASPPPLTADARDVTRRTAGVRGKVRLALRPAMRLDLRFCAAGHPSPPLTRAAASGHDHTDTRRARNAVVHCGATRLRYPAEEGPMAEDFLPIIDWDHIEFYVSNAK